MNVETYLKEHLTVRIGAVLAMIILVLLGHHTPVVVGTGNILIAMTAAFVLHTWTGTWLSKRQFYGRASIAAVVAAIPGYLSGELLVRQSFIAVLGLILGALVYNRVTISDTTKEL